MLQTLIVQRPSEPSPSAPAKPPAPSDGNPLAQKLERVAELAIDTQEKILLLPLPDNADDSFAAVLRAQNAAAATILATQVKVDENRLRKAAIDLLPEIIRVAREEEQKIRDVEANPED